MRAVALAINHRCPFATMPLLSCAGKRPTNLGVECSYFKRCNLLMTNRTYHAIPRIYWTTNQTADMNTLTSRHSHLRQDVANIEPSCSVTVRAIQISRMEKWAAQFLLLLWLRQYVRLTATRKCQGVRS